MFDVGDGAVGAVVEDRGAAALGLERADDGLHQPVIERVTDRPDRGLDGLEVEVLGEPNVAVLRPASECAISFGSGPDALVTGAVPANARALAAEVNRAPLRSSSAWCSSSRTQTGAALSLGCFRVHETRDGSMPAATVRGHG